MINPTAKFYKDMDILDYHAQEDVISKSMLGVFADCPRRYETQYLKGVKKEKTKSLRLGNAVHVLSLEPELWKSGYHVFPETYFDDKGAQKEWRNDKRNKTYQDNMMQAGYEPVISEATGKIEGFEPRKNAKVTLDRKEFQLVESMAEALAKDPAARSLLKAPGYVESSIFWEDEHTYIDPTTGEEKTTTIKKRCRPDFMRNDAIMPDLKIARSVKPGEFFNDARKFHYDLSPALSFEGYEALHGKEADNYVFIAVEQEFPHLVETFEVIKPMNELNGMSYLEYGQAHLKYLLDRFAHCRTENTWPKYQEGIGTMRVPEYAMRAYFERGEFV